MISGISGKLDTDLGDSKWFKKFSEFLKEGFSTFSTFSDFLSSFETFGFFVPEVSKVPTEPSENLIFRESKSFEQLMCNSSDWQSSLWLSG